MNCAASVDQRPPFAARTTSLARLPSPTSSGYVTSFCAFASSKAAPLFLAHGASVPSARTTGTNVVSMANWAPWNRLRPSTTTSKRRPSAMWFAPKIHVTDQHVGHDLPACFSAHARCNRLQSETPPTQNSHSSTCCGGGHKGRMDGHTGSDVPT